MDNLFQFENHNNAKPNTDDLGKSLLTWQVSGNLVKKAWFFMGGLIGALVIILLIFGRVIFPWLAKLPDFIIYLFIFMLSPLLKMLGTHHADKEYTLFTHGYMIKTSSKGKQLAVAQGKWRHFKSCSYTGDRVTLKSYALWNQPVTLKAPQNARDVYIICRERIGMTREDAKEAMRTGLPPKESTHEKRLRRVTRIMNKRYARM